MFKRILVSLDGSRRAEQALVIAARLARASGGTVVLLRAVSLPDALVSYIALEPIPLEMDMEAAYEEARNYLDGITTGSSLAGIHTNGSDHGPASGIYSLGGEHAAHRSGRAV